MKDLSLEGPECNACVVRVIGKKGGREGEGNGGTAMMMMIMMMVMLLKLKIMVMIDSYHTPYFPIFDSRI